MLVPHRIASIGGLKKLPAGQNQLLALIKRTCVTCRYYGTNKLPDGTGDVKLATPRDVASVRKKSNVSRGTGAMPFLTD
jgi:hypothetical protein